MKIKLSLVAVAFTMIISGNHLKGDDAVDTLYPPRVALIRLTSQLPDADEVQIAVIHKVNVVQMNSPLEVEKTRTMQSDKSAFLVRLWRKQHWNYKDHTGISDPHYRIRFFNKGTLILEATLMHSTGLWDVRFLRTDLQVKIPTPAEAMFASETEVGEKLTAFIEDVIK